MTLAHEILVGGGTGKVGNMLAGRLAARGADAAILSSRGPAAAGEMGPLPAVHADLTDPDSLVRAFRGADRLFLVTPNGPDEARMGRNALDAAAAAGIDKIVYLGVQHMDSFDVIPHVAAKRPVLDRLAAWPRHTVLAPNFFFQNDIPLLPAIRDHGVYPLPVGPVGVHAVDVADIAEAAETALFTDDWTGRVVALAGDQCLTGEAIAAIWADALGRHVAYGGDDVDNWIAALRAQVPVSDWFANDLAIMMREVQVRGYPANDRDLADTHAILGRAPTRYADFVQRTLAARS